MRLTGRANGRLCSAAHRPHLAAYAAWRQARAQLAAGHPRSQVKLTLQWAAAAATAIEAVCLREEIAALARLARVDVAGHAGTPVEPAVPLALRALTSRELDVLDALGEGLSNRGIAERLFISPRTVGVHVSSILRKLEVPDRIQAAQMARRLRGPAAPGV